MLSSTAPTLVAFIMESLQQLDPTLVAFWEGFPCPPPWKEELLFRLNWTGCVGLEVGERMRSFMADKCNIRHDGKRILPDLAGGGKSGGGGGGEDGLLVEEECGLPCQIVVSVICVLFLALLCIVIIFCVRKHRSKSSSPTHQSSLTAHPDGTKYYTSCHYACAPVVARQLQTSVSGDRVETSVLPPGLTDANGHYQPGSYPQHSCVQANYEHHHLLIPHQHHHHHRHHQQQQQQQPRLINTPYGQVPAHTSTIIVPNHHFGLAGPSGQLHGHPYSLRKLDAGLGAYSSTSGGSNSDPVYESIGGDSDSARHTSLSEEGYCEYCDCGVHLAGGDLGGGRTVIPGLDAAAVNGRYCGSQLPVSSPMSEPYHAQHERPVFFNSGNNNFFTSNQAAQKEPHGERSAGEKGSKACGDYERAGDITAVGQSHEDPPTPCPPMAGYYGDACPQTLPLRPLRAKPLSSHRDARGGGDDAQNKTEEAMMISQPTEQEEQEGIVPLGMSEGPVFPAEDVRTALLGGDNSASSGQGMRRRPIPASRESGGGDDRGSRRNIPALHPSYFLAASTDQGS